jgi:hypothetical protein
MVSGDHNFFYPIKYLTMTISNLVLENIYNLVNILFFHEAKSKLMLRNSCPYTLIINVWILKKKGVMVVFLDRSNPIDE